MYCVEAAGNAVAGRACGLRPVPPSAAPRRAQVMAERTNPLPRNRTSSAFGPRALRSLPPENRTRQLASRQVPRLTTRFERRDELEYRIRYILGGAMGGADLLTRARHGARLTQSELAMRARTSRPVSYTHLRAHETVLDL